ncbi:hypothetical protein [Amycolatopsis sp. NPDC004079]|uniref:hypothetical protein n=1 Tax=Amycolatopsis sp. NPDC004079 TaxID=3154549 RepID=UPI0033B45C56
MATAPPFELRLIGGAAAFFGCAACWGLTGADAAFSRRSADADDGALSSQHVTQPQLWLVGIRNTVSGETSR